MKKRNIFKHILFRTIIIIALTFASIFIGLSTLNPDRTCGTGDVLAIIPWFLAFYILWSLVLFYEIFYLAKRKQKLKRNANIIMILLLPVIIILFLLFNNV
jgi:hypothetical protein